MPRLRIGRQHLALKLLLEPVEAYAFADEAVERKLRDALLLGHERVQMTERLKQFLAEMVRPNAQPIIDLVKK